MVDKFKKILAEIEKDKKEVSLFAILKMDELTDRWSVIFSANGLDEETKRKEVFEYLVNLIIKNLGEEDIKSIARVGVFPLSNHLVQDLLKYNKNLSIKESTPVNGNIIHEGYILESNTTTSLN